MKKLFAILIAMVMCAVVVPMVNAANEDTINVTLHPGGTIDIEVFPVTWVPSASIGTSGNHDAKNGTIYNHGTVACTVDILTNITTVSDPWTLVANGSVDVDKVYFGINTGAGEHSLASTFEDAFALDNAHSEVFQLVVTMPTASSTSGDQSATITYIGTPA